MKFEELDSFRIAYDRLILIERKDDLVGKITKKLQDHNGFVAYGYVDHIKGFIYVLLYKASISAGDGRVKFYEMEDSGNVYIPAAEIPDENIIVLDPVKLAWANDLASEKIAAIREKYKDDPYREMRDRRDLDKYRNNYYPDAIECLVRKDIGDKVIAGYYHVLLQELNGKSFSGQLLQSVDPRFGIDEGDYVNGELSFLDGEENAPVIDL